MTAPEEAAMHVLATQLADLTRDPGWEASRYMVIGQLVKRLTEYCAVCECTERRNRLTPKC